MNRPPAEVRLAVLSAVLPTLSEHLGTALEIGLDAADILFLVVDQRESPGPNPVKIDLFGEAETEARIDLYQRGVAVEWLATIVPRIAAELATATETKVLIAGFGDNEMTLCAKIPFDEAHVAIGRERARAAMSAVVKDPAP